MIAAVCPLPYYVVRNIQFNQSPFSLRSLTSVARNEFRQRVRVNLILLLRYMNTVHTFGHINTALRVTRIVDPMIPANFAKKFSSQTVKPHKQ